jgi:hypothetical protein
MKLRFDALALTIVLKRATPLFLTLASIGCGGGQTGRVLEMLGSRVSISQ